MKVAVVGASGLVGRKMLQVLYERNFPLSEIFVAASEKSIGKKVYFGKKELVLRSIEDVLEEKPDIALFSAGSAVSREYAPKFAQMGTFVIDNSSAWRMEPNIKLIVPEINGNTIEQQDRIIANPNCSTIQMVMALYPLHKEFVLKRIVVSTYQSITGTGQKALEQLQYEEQGKVPPQRVYPYQIHRNVLPHCDIFMENGYTKEEMKLINETRKILNAPSIEISATAVRVPVIGGHSESVYVEMQKDFSLEQVRELLGNMPGVVIMDDPSQNIYPMPILSADRDEVFVGRLRRDLFNPKALSMWIVADNLRKGAATNAVQIAQIIAKKFFNL